MAIFRGMILSSYDLSILIPARNEQYISNTVEDILKNKRGKTEILVGLDGEWADPPIPDHPDVRIIYVSESIGQRGMQNKLASLSTAKYVAKTDAHCCFAEGFDVELLKTFEELGEDITIAPLMKNLHAFDWKCNKCGNRWYQGPTPIKCMVRGKHTSDMEPNPDCDNTENFTQRMVFEPRPDTPNSCSYRFNHTLQFQYWNEYKARQSGDLVESLSLQGSFFMATRKNYWEKELCDESWGSWGNQGTEVALKTHLSGGKVIINKRTWYAHLFRTQPGFSFPYQQSGKAQQRARQISQDIFFNNRWSGQIYPLSWVIEKFKPIPDWHDGSSQAQEALKKVMEAAVSFTSKQSITGLTSSSSAASDSRGKLMPSDAVSPTGLDGTVTVSSKDISTVANESQVVGVDALSVMTDMVNDGNVSTKVRTQRTDEPGVHDPMDSPLGASKPYSSVPEVVAIPHPQPATVGVAEVNLAEQPLNKGGVEVVDSEPISLRHSPHSISQEIKKVSLASGASKGILYFTDNQLPMKLAWRVRRTLREIAKAKNMELVSLTIKPIKNMGKNVVVEGERSYLQMFKQILAGLEAMESDIVFMAEHDVLYPPEHFDFTPTNPNKFYYDVNWYKVHEDGLVVRWRADQVSGLCAYRQLLIDHYKERIASFDKENFDRKFEPMSGEQSEQWESAVPYIDIRRDGRNKNLTYNKRELAHFRNKATAIDFQTTTIDTIPGWNLTIEQLYS